MPADRLLSLVQLCIRTGQFAKGDALLPSIQATHARLVVMSEACGANRAKKIRDKCAYYHVPLLVLPALRFNAISSKVNMAVALLNQDFATKTIELARQEGLLEEKD